MLVTKLKLRNWRNFSDLDVPLRDRCYIIGANASGKSNLLDVFRFLRTIAQNEGGGLQKALKERRGMRKVRSLHARKNPAVHIEVELSELSDNSSQWRYVLEFKSEGVGQRRTLIQEESVYKDGEQLLKRPNSDDKRDPARLTQTHLEQINNNAEFRDLSDFFAQTLYLHLVPQLLKHGDEMNGRVLENDPFGQGLLQRIAQASGKVRNARLRRIQQALEVAVPQFKKLQFVQDEVSGAPHLEANFNHWREHGAWQREDQFSDGTLRLIGFLWSLQEGDGLLLLEEPELSLNNAIIERIPLLIDRVLRDRKKGLRQIIITTHSEPLIGEVNPGDIILLEPNSNATLARTPTPDELAAVKNGLNSAEVLMPNTHPKNIEQMGRFE